jgi:hypothetical protein
LPKDPLSASLLRVDPSETLNGSNPGAGTNGPAQLDHLDKRQRGKRPWVSRNMCRPAPRAIAPGS